MPEGLDPTHTSVPQTPELHCVVCQQAFDFAAQEAALVLRHVAYGYDSVHDTPALPTRANGSSSNPAMTAERSLVIPSVDACWTLRLPTAGRQLSPGRLSHPPQLGECTPTRCCAGRWLSVIVQNVGLERRGTWEAETAP